MAARMAARADIYVTSRKPHLGIHNRTGGRYGFGFSDWDMSHVTDPSPYVEEYDHEDEVLVQLARLPSADNVRDLIGRLRNPELKELAQGVIIDVSVGARNRNNLETMKAINSWMATAAEPLASRRSIRHVLAARERGRARRTK